MMGSTLTVASILHTEHDGLHLDGGVHLTHRT
jgi:hypothetical protein